MFVLIKIFRTKLCNAKILYELINIRYTECFLNETLPPQIKKKQTNQQSKFIFLNTLVDYKLMREFRKSFTSKWEPEGLTIGSSHLCIRKQEL